MSRSASDRPTSSRASTAVRSTSTLASHSARTTRPADPQRRPRPGAALASVFGVGEARWIPPSPSSPDGCAAHMPLAESGLDRTYPPLVIVVLLTMSMLRACNV
jgi:hypothetical protein